MTRAVVQLPVTGTLPSFEGGTQWLNSPPLAPEDLKGKVVLVSFWTYTCINWLRTLPYLRAWAQKYKDHGLVLIGVHTPEFAFEHKVENVQQAINTMKITYPVVTDNRYAIWTAFDNHYWPALYFADADGRIRYHQFGEGEYEMSERVIQQLLTEAGNSDFEHDLVSVDPDGAEVAADWEDVESPETYLGYERGFSFAYPRNFARGSPQQFNVPIELQLNQWTLLGEWAVDRGGIISHAANGKILYRFHARDLNLVMGPVTLGDTVKFRVRIDGEPPREAYGEDVDRQGNGTVKEQRLYQLIRQPQPIADRLFEIEFLDPGVEALAFTFG
jgi:thiol-disulfide isomerase/thioredoxin